MTRSDNTTTITGNLADDPELRFTPSGVAVVNLRVAVNGRRKTDSGDWEDDLDGFFNVAAWRELAENVAESLHKGDRVTIVARLKVRTYEDRDGNTRYVTDLIADEVAANLRWATVTISKRGGSNRPPHPADSYDDRGRSQARDNAPPPPPDDDVPF